MISVKTKNYVFRTVIGLLTFITFFVLHDLAHYLYTTYITTRIYRGVSNMFVFFYVFIVFPAPCLLMPYIKEHRLARTIVMALPPFFLTATFSFSTNPKRTTLLVLLTVFSYFMIIALELLGEWLLPFTREKMIHSGDAIWGISLYLFSFVLLFFCGFFL